MAIPWRTDWSKMRYSMFVLYFTSALLASTIATRLTTSGKQKRQLFREHLLPQQGGKIPVSAFNHQRILLNKFAQNGFYSTNGYHIEQSHPHLRSPPKEIYPNTIKIYLYPDNRNVAPPGRTFDPITVDTTYLKRVPVNQILYPTFKQYVPLPFFPHDSLKSLRYFKYDKKADDEAWKALFANNDLPEKILQDLAPYLRKLHESD